MQQVRSQQVTLALTERQRAELECARPAPTALAAGAGCGQRSGGVLRCCAYHEARTGYLPHATASRKRPRGAGVGDLGQPAGALASVDAEGGGAVAHSPAALAYLCPPAEADREAAAPHQADGNPHARPRPPLARVTGRYPGLPQPVPDPSPDLLHYVGLSAHWKAKTVGPALRKPEVAGCSARGRGGLRWPNLPPGVSCATPTA